MRVVIFGGTGEGEEIAYRLAGEGLDVIVCVATEYGDECQKRLGNMKVIAGRQDENEMLRILSEADICIDATHPYAEIVSKNIIRACNKADVKLMRYVRPKSQIDESVITACDTDEAASILSSMEGNILLTTGSKDLHKFSSLGGDRLFVRVLPLEESLLLCKAAGIPSRNIIAMQGPFIEEVNQALIKQFNIKIMVSKNSGQAGGFDEKVKSCKVNDCKLVVIGRPSEEDGWDSIDEIIEMCLEEK